MTIRNLDRLLEPKSVALIGASPEFGSVGRIVAGNLLDGGFAGPMWFVNPRHADVAGMPCYPSVAALPATPDLAIIATPPATVPGLVAELGARGTRAVVVITAGLGAELRQAMLDAARPNLLRIQGPNCLGLMLPRVGLNASFSHRLPAAGDLALISQSGAIITGVVDWAADRGIGFSHVVSLGDMADADFGDFLDYLAGDTKSRAILLYMEQLTQAPKFMSAARRAARAKPVIVIKSGRHAAGARAAMSHTGALAGSDAAYDAAFRRAGLLRVMELEELFNAAEMLARTPRLTGERLMILTNGGGAGVLAADRLADFDGTLATLGDAEKSALEAVLPATWSRANPVDIIGDAGPDRYAAAIDVLLQSPASDALLVMNCPTALASSTEAAEAVVARVEAQRIQGPARVVLTNWLGEGAAQEARTLFAAHGIASFETPGAAITGFSQLVRYSRAQDELMRAPPSMPAGMQCDAVAAHDVIAGALAAGRTQLSEFEAKALLAAYGVPVVETAIAATTEEVARLASAILAKADACVVKVLSDDISHKSDVGGVRLGLDSAEAAVAAAREIVERVARVMPKARIKGFTVQPMVRRPHAQELILGMTVDETFGPMLMFGAGGVGVEVMADTRQALPPLDLNLAQEMMRGTRVYRLLEGYRDRPRAKLDDIAVALVRLSSLIIAHPEIRELDINPLLADEQGVVALDARVRIEGAASKPRRPMAIRPYPMAWRRDVLIPDVGDVEIRPIRPDDEQLYEAFFAKLDPHDLRMRFFTAAPHLSHKLVSRLTQIDYAREMAFVAVDDTSGELLGVARLAADPDYRRAEYAVLVRSDLKGRGLGWQLMSQLVAYARIEKLSELFGSVLTENTGMLKMCAALGFRIEAEPDDLTLRRVTLDLTQQPTDPSAPE